MAAAAATTADAADLDFDIDSDTDPDLDPDLNVEGEMEDDWADSGDEEPQDVDPVRVRAPGTLEKFGISEREAELWEKGVDAMFKEGGKFPADIKKELKENFAGPGLLEAFEGVGAGGTAKKWLDVPLNDTWLIQVAQVPGAAAQFIEMMRTESEATDSNLDAWASGDSVWPSAVVLARWLTISPPPKALRGLGKEPQERTGQGLEGLVVVELGAGLGLPGVLAARLGAASVLLQDRDERPLQQAMETAVSAEVADRITSLRCDWSDLPGRLLAAKEGEALAPFAQADAILAADVLFSEAVALSLAEVLAQLLRNPGQVAFIVDPYKREHRKAFGERCRAHGLEVVESEIVTWEPEGDNRLENDEEWVTRLLMVRRIS